ncbi:MAG TPA: glycosyltransferase family 4 protein [Bacteroidia bacterium]|nr:glycosyltransferase family 4 protein [Bacteroidia bacterium]
MDTSRKKILCWAGWYRCSQSEYSAIFIKKHLDVISKFADLHCFNIQHKKGLFWYNNFQLNESFGKITIYQIPSFFPLKHLGYFLIPFIEGIKCKKQFKKIDIFHLHVSYPFAVFTYLLELLNIKKWILSEHWSGYTFKDNSFNKLNSLLKFLLTKRLNRFQKISVISNYLKVEMQKRFHFSDEKIIIIPNVLKVPEFIPEKKLNSNKFKLLTISNLVNYPKNISFLIKMISELSKEYPDIILNVYGDGKDREKLMELAEKLGSLNKNIFFKGKIDNDKISDVYFNHHAFILLSLFETFSIVTAEAILHGLPVIVTKCGGPEEFVNEKNGILVPINDEESTKKAILHIYQNYSRYNPKTVQSTMLSNYSEESISQKFQSIYS